MFYQGTCCNAPVAVVGERPCITGCQFFFVHSHYNTQTPLFTGELLILLQFLVLGLISWPLKRAILENVFLPEQAKPTALGIRLMNAYVRVLRIVSGINALTFWIWPVYIWGARRGWGVKDTWQTHGVFRLAMF